MIVGSMKGIIYPNGNSKICIESELTDDINYFGSADRRKKMMRHNFRSFQFL